MRVALAHPLGKSWQTLRSPTFQAAWRSRRFLSQSVIQRDDHHHGHHDHHGSAHDPNEYPPTDFSAACWRNMFLGSMGVFVLWNANSYYEATRSEVRLIHYDSGCRRKCFIQSRA
jgi:hypothetical protein